MNKPTILEVMPLVKAYYEKPENGAGGNLHIVLDDGNIEAMKLGDISRYDLKSIVSSEPKRDQKAQFIEDNPDHFE